VIRIIQNILRFISFSSFPIAAAALMMSIAYSTLLNEEVYFERALINGLATFIIYNLVQIIPFFYKEQVSQKALWFKKHLKVLIVLIFIALILLLPLVLRLNFFDLLNYLHLGGLCLLYEGPMKYTLRKLPYTKALVISYIWSMIIIMPQFYDNIYLPNFLYFLEFFFYIFALSLAFDYRDRLNDHSENIKTFVNIISAKQAKLLVITLYIISGLILIYLVGINIFSILSFLIHIIVLLLMNEKRGQLYYLLGIDGLMIIKSVLMLYSIIE